MAVGSMLIGYTVKPSVQRPRGFTRLTLLLQYCLMVTSVYFVTSGLGILRQVLVYTSAPNLFEKSGATSGVWATKSDPYRVSNYLVELTEIKRLSTATNAALLDWNRDRGLEMNSTFVALKWLPIIEVADPSHTSRF